VRASFVCRESRFGASFGAVWGQSCGQRVDDLGITLAALGTTCG
jgi:hypothetical protein